MITILDKCENFNKIKGEMHKIPIGYLNCNGDDGFFAELKEEYYPLIGIKIASKSELIDSKFYDVEYYLLESKKVVKFVDNISSKDWIYTKSFNRAMKELEEKEIIQRLNDIIEISEDNFIMKMISDILDMPCKK